MLDPEQAKFESHIRKIQEENKTYLENIKTNREFLESFLCQKISLIQDNELIFEFK